MRKKIIIGNWKMNKTLSETQTFIQEINKVQLDKQKDIGIAVPFVNLVPALQENKNLIIAAQNCYYEPHGAYTGEISINMLQAINVKYVIIGHSERRMIFKENDEMINKKVLALVNNEMVPILCCGETLTEYEQKQTNTVVANQIKKALTNVNEKFIKNIVIAYEPIWAIGTGKTATAELAQQLCQFIRSEIAKLYNSNIAQEIRIQYGGSVNEKNVTELLAQKDIDGALVGGASLQTSTFLQLVQ